MLAALRPRFAPVEARVKFSSAWAGRDSPNSFSAIEAAPHPSAAWNWRLLIPVFHLVALFLRQIDPDRRRVRFRHISPPVTLSMPDTTYATRSSLKRAGISSLRHNARAPPIRRQAQETLAGAQQIATLPLPQVAARKAYVRARQRTPALHPLIKAR